MLDIIHIHAAITTVDRIMKYVWIVNMDDTRYCFI